MKTIVADLLNMTYIQAFLHMTVECRMPHKASIEFLYFLADKYPQTRLAVHVRATSSASLDEVG